MTTQRYNQFITYLIVYTVMLFLSNDAYLPALPQMMQDLHTSYHGAQLTMTMWFLGSASVELILGPLSDRYGKRIIIILGGVFFVVSSFICASSPNLSILLIARLIQGASVASMLVAGMACVHQIFESKQAVKVLGKINSITILAPALGPLAGAILLYIISWRDIFMLLAIFAFLSLIGIYFKMPNYKDERHSLQIKKILANYKEIILNKRFTVNTVSYCCLFASLIAWITVGPFIIVDQFHLSKITFAICQMVIFGGFIIGSLSLKLALFSNHPYMIVRIGLILNILIILLSLTLTILFPTNYIVALIIPLCCYAYISGALMPILSRKAIDASNSPHGATLAVQATLFCGFGALSSAVIGYFYHGTYLPLVLMILIFSCIALTSAHKNYEI